MAAIANPGKGDLPCSSRIGMKLKLVAKDDGSPYGVRFDCPGCGDPQ